ncbi:Bro-N domain-containing protein [Pseudomonas chlororaphis subsp. aureofaciens]|uniref:BRO-N domain-containing protein n=1 Tax=Pseudomonas chlororaphis TaxID=587753 RepID=UPI0035578A9E
MNKSSRHEKAPSAPTLEAGEAERQSIRKNVMSNNSTNVIPFNFGKQQVRTMLVSGDPWFSVQDILRSLDYTDSYKPARAAAHVPDQWKGVHRLHTPGGTQQALMLSEQGLYFFIGRSDKPKALPFQMWIAGEVLPAIRKTGSYTDSSNKMATLVDDVIGVSGTNLINGIIGQKVAKLPAGIQRQAKHKLHAILHTRFNVPRTELIPAGKLDVACEYLAAYALEGEFLPKDSSQGNGLPGQLSPTQRFLVFTDHAGNQQVQPISREACVMTHREMISGMINGDIMVSTPEMFEFLAAVTENLRLRSLNQARRAAA